MLIWSFMEGFRISIGFAQIAIFHNSWIFYNDIRIFNSSNGMC